MDFLDPQKQRRQTILLSIGYVLIAIAILISTVVLVYQANGFGVNRQGQIVQNGLVFFSSQPNPANIYLNGKLNSARTNARLSLVAGEYQVRISRAGYRDWNRPISVLGGDVQHFDYPLLFPNKLDVTKQVDLPAAPGISAQSLDRRWLMVQQSPTSLLFNFYDLKNPTDPPEPITLPTNMVSQPNAAHTWTVVQWADDNTHVLLQHTLTDGSTEYIVVDRTDATKTVNLNKLLNANPAKLTLIDNKYDQYHLLGPEGTLNSASLDDPTLTKIVDNVADYKSYGSKTVLYATTANAPAGKANIMMRVDDKTYPIRTIAASDTYLLNAAGYRGVLYVVIGSAAENAAYVYQDPVGQLQSDDELTRPSASRALRVTDPTYLAFSQNAQYIAVEGGTSFGVYDLYLHHSYRYSFTQPLDAPQPHATWMDGNRLDYVSNGKLFVFDYDQRNQQTLMAVNPTIGAFFAPDYRFIYNLTTDADGANHLTQTSLLAPADR